jgi:arsenate reductase
MTAHWGIPDPAAVQGTTEQVERAFSHAFFMLDRLTLKQEIDKIGQQ